MKVHIVVECALSGWCSKGERHQRLYVCVFIDVVVVIGFGVSNQCAQVVDESQMIKRAQPPLVFKTRAARRKGVQTVRAKHCVRHSVRCHGKRAGISVCQATIASRIGALVFGAREVDAARTFVHTRQARTTQVASYHFDRRVVDVVARGCTETFAARLRASKMTYPTARILSVSAEMRTHIATCLRTSDKRTPLELITPHNHTARTLHVYLPQVINHRVNPTNGHRLALRTLPPPLSPPSLTERYKK